ARERGGQRRGESSGAGVRGVAGGKGGGVGVAERAGQLPRPDGDGQPALGDGAANGVPRLARPTRDGGGDRALAQGQVVDADRGGGDVLVEVDEVGERPGQYERAARGRDRVGDRQPHRVEVEGAGGGRERAAVTEA